MLMKSHVIVPKTSVGAGLIFRNQFRSKPNVTACTWKAFQAADKYSSHRFPLDSRSHCLYSPHWSPLQDLVPDSLTNLQCKGFNFTSLRLNTNTIRLITKLGHVNLYPLVPSSHLSSITSTCHSLSP